MVSIVCRGRAEEVGKEVASVTAERLTNVVELILLEENNSVPEGTITYIDVKLCDDGSAYVGMGIDPADDDDVSHIVLQIDKQCVRRIDENNHESV